MQKVINVLAVLSFAVSTGVVAASSYVYVNKDSLRAEVEKQITDGVKNAINEALGGALTSELANPVAGMNEVEEVPTLTSPF